MIWSYLVDFIFTVFDKMIDYVPSVSFDIPQGALNGLETLCANVGYILPIDDLLVVFDLWIAYMSFRIGVSFYKNRVKIRV